MELNNQSVSILREQVKAKLLNAENALPTFMGYIEVLMGAYNKSLENIAELEKKLAAKKAEEKVDKKEKN